jgi:hypothetical protein
MRLYGINIAQLALKLVPVKIRKDRMAEWISALLQPIQSLNVRFVQLVVDVRYRMNFNGQVIYLEHILNDVFDSVSRGIYIDDDGTTAVENYVYNVPEPTVFLRNKAETQPTIILFNSIEFNELNGDFVIHVPSYIVLNADVERQIRKIVDRYKHVGRRYIIEAD